MTIRCTCNYVSNENSPSPIVKWANNTELEISVGEIYTVLAITKLFDEIFYYILSDESDEYPLAFPYHLFELEDNRISKYWDAFTGEIENPNSINIANGDVISFKEWSLKKDLFYENLLEGNSNEVGLFFRYRNKMLSE